MNIWAQMLAEAPPTLQRLIARAQRVSLPRGATPETRLSRLRLALCHARTVRVTYFALAPEVQAALQQLRTCRGGLPAEQITARFGAIRPYSDIAADRKPRTISEQLLLLGWLLPRPAAPRHPSRFMLPPEVRAWLPRPLSLADQGAAPPALPPLAVRAAITILLACAERPLPLRLDGTLRVTSQRDLNARLAPLGEDEARALCQFTLPLLIDLGLLAPHGAAAALAPAGARFLAQCPEQQLRTLRAAWVRTPKLDAWLRPLLVDARGLDLPLLRRRLLIWARALPLGRLLDPSPLYAALADALGPLADAHTHGFRAVDRAPWQPKRAAAVWDAALRGPLTWLGSIGWANAGGPSAGADRRFCFATPAAQIDVSGDQWQEAELEHTHDDALSTTASSWRYGENGELRIAHAALDTAVLRLLPLARWQGADTSDTIYQVSPRTLAAAARAGHSVDSLRTLLEHRAGPLPATWRASLPGTIDTVRIIHTAVALSDNPAVLARAAEARGVRRYLEARLAPGIALVDPKRAPTLARVLARGNLAVELRGEPTISRPADFTPAECATLLHALSTYRRQAPQGASPAALEALDARLRAALPNQLRNATRPLLDSAPSENAPSPGAAGAAEVVGASAEVPPIHRRAEAPVASGERTGPGRPRRSLLAPLLAATLALWLVLPSLLRGRRYTIVPANASGVTPPEPPARSPSDYLPLLACAIRRRQALQIGYQSAEATMPTERIVRPLRLESHGDQWYLHAYCTLRQAERLFRVDRISALTVLDHAGQVRAGLRRSGPGRPAKLTSEAPTAAPRSPRRARPKRLGASFFPIPPDPPSGSPLVRIWLVEDG
jgi:predicted DNA-binding transcriptional regulator YafY